MSLLFEHIYIRHGFEFKLNIYFMCWTALIGDLPNSSLRFPFLSFFLFYSLRIKKEKERGRGSKDWEGDEWNGYGF
jgi:hypothetical protein